METALPPAEILALLHRIEAQFGRRRAIRDEARSLDLDILDYDGKVEEGPGLVLPHPRLHQRAFVLKPLAEIVPNWRHPRLGQTVSALIAALPPDQTAEAIAP